MDWVAGVVPRVRGWLPPAGSGPFHFWSTLGRFSLPHPLSFLFSEASARAHVWAVFTISIAYSYSRALAFSIPLGVTFDTWSGRGGGLGSVLVRPTLRRCSCADAKHRSTTLIELIICYFFHLSCYYIVYIRFRHAVNAQHLPREELPYRSKAVDTRMAMAAFRS